MSARKPRWEIVSSIDGQYFARFIAANGKKIVTSETYKRKRDALRAVALVTDAISAADSLDGPLEIRDLTTEPKR